MAHIIDLGRRIELLPMDAHFRDITIALYERSDTEGASEFVVHTYSGLDGADARVDFVVDAMKVLGGLQVSASRRLGFACGADHRVACRRIFLESCKADPQATPEVRGLSVFDKKSGHTIAAESAGPGAYHLTADGDGDDLAQRLATVSGGLVKLGGMRAVGDDGAAFDCGTSHDAVVGLLFGRALNARAVLRQDEMASARGILVAPSAQKQ